MTREHDSRIIVWPVVGAAEINELLSPVIDADGRDGVALVSVDDDFGEPFAGPLYRLILRADSARSPVLPPRHDPDPPRPDTVEGLASVLKPAALDSDRLLGLLVAMCTSDMEFFHPAGTWSAADVGAALEQAIDLLGPRVSWWSNCNFALAESWENGWPDAWPHDPLTRHTASMALMGVGAGIIVTFLSLNDG
ncbi:hypothetical protein KO481_13095 [Nocardia sp. NEAU-G5]|uniref:DUF4192 family protein n=1 Tax=Nocardia albiluteola TaxID=2842303 RepID=A0ABS6AZM6_9NOCA|nr:hypothetical protein [Nocardia albiluteola]MBU3062455.1 hypothetical protein [Nocardia albiluteola]